MGPSSERCAGPVARLLAGALALLLAACDSESQVAGARSLFEAERMAFVPVGSTVRTPGDLRSTTIGAVTNDLLVDRFEASRADWRHWTGAYPDAEGYSVDAAGTDSARASWPAFASFDEARDFAERRGMRLPRVREWVHIAVGSHTEGYPWGVIKRDSVANTLELGLHRPTPVGTFENGLSSSGIHDLIGNVAEWAVADGSPIGEILPQVPEFGSGVALGGSYTRRMRPVTSADGPNSVLGEALGFGVRGPDLGLRCVVEAERYLLTHAPSWASLPEAEPRLRALGQRWGGGAARLLARLRGQRPELVALAWLEAGIER
ncbi:MAG: SUMF1/EgtB/PvdO family nonheme iron enzyme [Planctomycetota bacterium]